MREGFRRPFMAKSITNDQGLNANSGGKTGAGRHCPAACPYRGLLSEKRLPVNWWLKKRAWAYLGAANLQETEGKKPVFVRITSAGLRESHVHDVIITKEAPKLPHGRQFKLILLIRLGGPMRGDIKKYWQEKELFLCCFAAAYCLLCAAYLLSGAIPFAEAFFRLPQRKVICRPQKISACLFSNLDTNKKRCQ